MTDAIEPNMTSKKEIDHYQRTLIKLVEEIEVRVKGKREKVELALLGAITGGHLLIEDVPGVGKTTLARALSTSLGGNFQRVQCTADLLPSDLTGVNIYHPKEGKFNFQEGPIFSHVLLTDELNRATPKAQSSLLEAMEEQQVTTDRKTRRLPYPFWVIATQNPQYFAGTFKLPESQLDRFALSISLGYLESHDEREVLLQGAKSSRLETSHKEVDHLEEQRKLTLWRSLIQVRETIKVSSDLVDYMINFANFTRHDPELSLGVSTRGVLSWLKLCQARALLHNRSFVIPEDVHSLALPALTHRVWPESSQQSREYRENYLQSLMSQISLPR